MKNRILVFSSFRTGLILTRLFKIFSVLVLFLFIIQDYSFGRDGVDLLIFKNKDVISGKIQSLNAWSVTLSDDNYYAIKMLSEIRTKDSSIVFQLKSYYPGIVVSNIDSTYILEVANLKLLPSDIYQNNFIYRFFVLLNILSARGEDFEFQLNFIPRFCKNVVGQFSASTGADMETNAICLNQASMGVGYILPLEGISLSALFNYAYKTLTPDYVSAQVTYVSIYTQIPFADDKALFSLGMRYHISNVPIKNEKTMWSVNIGIGYNFQITPY